MGDGRQLYRELEFCKQNLVHNQTLQIKSCFLPCRHDCIWNALSYLNVEFWVIWPQKRLEFLSLQHQKSALSLSTSALLLLIEYFSSCNAVMKVKEWKNDLTDDFKSFCSTHRSCSSGLSHTSPLKNRVRYTIISTIVCSWMYLSVVFCLCYGGLCSRSYECLHVSKLDPQAAS